MGKTLFEEYKVGDKLLLSIKSEEKIGIVDNIVLAPEQYGWQSYMFVRVDRQLYLFKHKSVYDDKAIVGNA